MHTNSNLKIYSMLQSNLDFDQVTIWFTFVSFIDAAHMHIIFHQ